MVKADVLMEEMDLEWLELILEAKQMGLAKETVREFLKQDDIREVFTKS